MELVADENKISLCFVELRHRVDDINIPSPLGEINGTPFSAFGFGFLHFYAVITVSCYEIQESKQWIFPRGDGYAQRT